MPLRQGDADGCNLEKNRRAQSEIRANQICRSKGVVVEAGPSARAGRGRVSPVSVFAGKPVGRFAYSRDSMVARPDRLLAATYPG